MGFRYYKRVQGKNGWGLNFSGSGISSSYRNKYGSFGSKGYSIKTDIPGLTFRGSWGRGKNKGETALILLGILLALYLGYLAILLLYNMVLFIVWACTELVHFFLRIYYRWKEKQALKREWENTALPSEQSSNVRDTTIL